MRNACPAAAQHVGWLPYMHHLLQLIAARVMISRRAGFRSGEGASGGSAMDTEPDRTLINHRRLDALRTGKGPLGQHVIDEFVAGRLPRREFLRRGTMIGL